MLRFFRIALSLLLTSSVFGQNLVPNPSFEEYNHCTGDSNAVDFGWANHWFVPNEGYTPDYFNSCSSVSAVSIPQNVWGYQEAVGGQAYMGFYSFADFWAEGREFISVRLTTPLTAGNSYVFEAHFSLAETVLYSAAQLGGAFTAAPPISASQVFDASLLSYNEVSGFFTSDDVWVLFNDTIVSNGNEEYLTIGCVRRDSNTDTLAVGSENSIPMSYYYVDDVSLIPLDSLLLVETLESTQFDLYPNPASETVQIQLKQEEVELLVTDVLGRSFYDETLRSTQSNRLELDVNRWPNGIYLVSITNKDGIRSTQRLIVQH